MKRTTVAEDTIYIEMNLDPDNPNIDVESTAGELHEFMFTPYLCIAVSAIPGLSPTIYPTDESPSDSQDCSWVIEYPLDATIGFKARRNNLESDIAEALEGLPLIAKQTAKKVAEKAFEAIDGTSKKELNEIAEFYDPFNLRTPVEI